MGKSMGSSKRDANVSKSTTNIQHSVSLYTDVLPKTFPIQTDSSPQCGYPDSEEPEPVQQENCDLGCDPMWHPAWGDVVDVVQDDGRLRSR